MNKIKCLICDEEMESKSLHDKVMCSCDNEAFANGGNAYQQVGAEDITKIEIWCDVNSKYRKATF